MKTIAMLLLLISGRHPGEQARSYREAPEITRGRMILWQDPGAVERLDFRYGAGGRALEPRPPFTFLEEDKSGTSPKLTVRDAGGRKWSVKFGGEAGADNFASRLVWAAGYVPEINYYISEGVIEGVSNLRRTKRYVDPSGRFQGARFQLRGGDRAFVDGVSW